MTPANAVLIPRNLTRVGLHHPIQRFAHGQETLDLLFRPGPGPHRPPDTA